MLKWKQIADDFFAISVGKEYNGEPYYWTTFYYYKGLLVDSACPHAAEESVNFIKDVKLSVEAVLITHYHEDHSGGHAYSRRGSTSMSSLPENHLKSLQTLQKSRHTDEQSGVNRSQ